MEENNSTLHMNEIEGLRFAHIHLNNVQQELALAVKYLTSSTHEYTWERIKGLAGIGSIISEIMEDMQEQVMTEVCDCEACVKRRGADEDVVG